MKATGSAPAGGISTGVRSGGTATAVRGTTRLSAGGGLESGRSSGSSAFGNTESFKVFSSRSFATIARGKSTESGRPASLNISPTGSIERSTKPVLASQSTSRRESTSGLTKQFGQNWN